jgi:hypothetical protein
MVKTDPSAATARKRLLPLGHYPRHCDINQQMRVIAQELKPHEMHAVAGYYGAAGDRD